MRLSESFYRLDALDAAPALVGTYLCRRTSDGRLLRGLSWNSQVMP